MRSSRVEIAATPPNHIDGYAQSQKLPVNAVDPEQTVRRFIRQDDAEIEIAIRVLVAPRGGTEQVDSPR